MESLASHSVCLLLLAAFITMVMVGVIMVTTASAPSDAARYVSSLAGPGSHISVGTTIDFPRRANRTEPCTKISHLLRRVNVRASLIPVYLVVSLVSIAVAVFLVYQCWRRKSSSCGSTAPVETRAEVHPLRRPPGYSSRATLPVYSPPPPPFPDERERGAGENIELPNWSHDRLPGQKPKQEHMHHPSPAPS